MEQLIKRQETAHCSRKCTLVLVIYLGKCMSILIYYFSYHMYLTDYVRQHLQSKYGRT